MADTKISALPVASILASTDIFPIVQGGTTKQTTISALRYPLTNATTAGTTIGATDTYLNGSAVNIAPGDLAAGCLYKASVFLSKTAAGTAAGTLLFRCGTTATTSDLAVYTVGLTAGTAVADLGIIEFFALFATPGASCTVQPVWRLTHNGQTLNGLWGVNPVSLATGVASSAFNSTAVTQIGLSYNGGTGAAHTYLVMGAELTY